MASREEIVSRQRNNLLKFMEKNKLNPTLWAKKANIAEATIRHFLSGRNSSITILSLELLAQAVNARPCDLLCDQ